MGGRHIRDEVSANLPAPTAGEPLGTASLRALHKFAAQHIFQAELDQLRDSAQAALAAQPAMAGQFPPARFDAPSSVRIPDVKFVGVPATAQDILEDSFTCDGFGGLEALIGVEGLSEAHVREIVRRVAPDAQVDRDFLVPQDSDWTPEEFRTFLERPGAKRELASLVRLYGSQDLARRVFWMVTMFRRALDRLDRAEAQLKSDGKTTSQQLLNADSELREVKRQFGLQQAYFEKMFASAREKMDQEAKIHDRDFKRAALEHKHQEDALQARNDELQRKVEDLEDHVRALDRRLRAGSLNVPRVMNFLNRGKTRVAGNWGRLKGLLELAKDNQPVPDAWATQILVNAADDFGADSGPYVFDHDGDTDEEEKGDGGSNADSGGSKDKPLDLTHSASSPPHTPVKYPRGKTSGSKFAKRATLVFQMRPDPWAPNEEDARDPREAPVRTVRETMDSLRDLPVIWSKLRTDIQLVMQSGLDYDDALELAKGDNVVHPRFDSRSLESMLFRMMYWHELDSTPWTKYVPSWYFKKAEALLEETKDSASVPERWGDLQTSRLDEARELNEALFSDVGGNDGDDDRDETFDSNVSDAGSSRRTTPPRAAKRRRSVTSDSGASAAGTSGQVVAPPAKKRRPAQERTKSLLARKSYSELSGDELWVIETPGRGVTSWRHHGVLIKFFPGTANAVDQTSGFPDYIPNLSVPEVITVVRERWDLAAFQAVYADKPWDTMFDKRSKFLIMHSRIDTNSVFVQGALSRIVAAMKKHRKAFWLVGHWYFVPTERDSATDVLVAERKKLCDTAKREYQLVLNDVVNEGLPETFLEEPGVWTYPAKCCSWVFMHASQKKAMGSRTP
ncbi:uncharacterized protein KRP23_2513 [Phytophthora ramorum]|uniref:uncharacterized protein n=1 Tax=Phytophthora ramorum TaxID=164328 RepID=UPI0030A68952|nr:hypothetical protein KRP23_2513 [Phytophthora ramorum]